MWKVYSDNYLIHHTELEDYKIFEASLELELNKTGSFTFTIYSDHPNYERLNKLKSIITVYQDNNLYFRGRILNDEVGWYNQRQVTCEGELAFLIDSIQRPFEFPVNEGDMATPEAYLQFLISRHNSQVDTTHQFTVGNVTVTDSNNYISRSDTEYSTTWQLINEGLINTHGGYLWIRHENGVNYLDYLEDFDVLSNQPIEFGKNLLELKKERKGEDIATAIIPIGATVTEDVTDETTGETTQVTKTITISDLPDETTGDVRKSGDYVYSVSGQSTFGKICKTVKWSDVTQASNLLTKAKAELAKSVLISQTIELTAGDLSAAGQNFNSFRLGTYVTAESDPHDLSSNYLVKKLSISLLNPANNKITLGETIYSFIEENQKRKDKEWQEIKTNVELSQSVAIRELEKRTSSSITQSEDSILSKVSSGYYTKDETDTKVSEISSELEQTAAGFTMRFNSIDQNIDDVQSGSDAQFEEIKKYIRFVDGNIILGEDGNQLVLKIQNDRISFLESNLEVAYFSNRKLYVTDGEYIRSLKLGKFAFLPRANGNLSFVKVVD